MSPHETYTAVMRHFWQCQREHSFQPSEMAVYFHLVDTCFTLEWKNPFKHANGYLCGALAISEKTLISARNRLQQAGLIRFESGKHRRDLSTYTLPLVEKVAGKAENIAPFRAETLHPYGQEVSSLSGANTPDNKREIITSSKSKKSTLSSEPHSVSLFEQFWEAYDKKVGKTKAAQKWAALSEAEQAAILAHIPAYVAATPDKQFRKDPATYLHNRTWEDEELPPPRTGQRLAAAPAPVASPPSPAAPAFNAAFLAEQDARAAAEQDAHFARYAVPA